jgi:hypothetical protein
MDNGVNGTVLLVITDEELRQDLQVNNSIHRRRILSELRELKVQAPAASP